MDVQGAPKIDAVKPEAPRFPGNVTIMSPGDRPGADAKKYGKRRFGAMAAMVALAAVAGALGGALATAGVGKLTAGDSAQASVQGRGSKLRWRGSTRKSSR